MKRSLVRALRRVALLAVCAPVPVSAGSLPALEEKPWTGFFVACENRGFHFGIGADGEMLLLPLNRQGQPADNHLAVRALWVVEEVRPDGAVAPRQVDPASLESSQKAAMDPDAVTIRGKTAAGETVELAAEFKGGRVSLGGRVTDVGSTRNPLRVAVWAWVPNAYPGQQREDEREFAKRTRRDRVTVEGVAGGREKIEAAEAVEAASDKVTGKGLRAVSVEFEAYQGRTIEFEVAGDAKIELKNEGEKPLFDGFILSCRPDPAKDKEGRARLVLQAD